MRSLVFRVLVAAALAVGVVPRPAAAGPACTFEQVDRIVAVGDIHGAHDQFVAILRAATLIDASNHWIGGRTHLVQVGDVVDRGPDSRKALDLLRQLTTEAEAAGGKVHVLIGNHEVMRMLGDVRFATPGEYAAFVGPGSDDLRRRYLATIPEAERAAIEKATPLGFVELTLAFGPDREYGAYLRGLNTVVRINGIVFVHGGISPAVAALSCDEINDTVRRELGAGFATTRKDPLRTLAAREDGPLWYRGLAAEAVTAQDVEALLAKQAARAIVIGHSVQARSVGVKFGGRVFAIDTGMQPAYQPNGRPSALDIQGTTFTAIYLDAREQLRGPPAEVQP